MQIATPPINKLSGEITLLGAVFNKLQEIKTELADHDYILAIKQYGSVKDNCRLGRAIALPNKGTRMLGYVSDTLRERFSNASPLWRETLLRAGSPTYAGIRFLALTEPY